MRLLEWFRFGKRIDEMGKEVERFKRKTEASHKRREQQLIELIKRCDELGEIEHIASEMAEALDAAGEVLDHMRIDDSPAAQSLKSQAQLAFVRVLSAQRRYEQWKEGKP